MRNRIKILFLACATLVVSLLTVTIVGYWYSQPTAVTIAVGPEGSPENRFAHRLAETLAQNHASIRLLLDVNDTRAQALLHFARREADLVILRTDERRIPPSARALAVLERDALLVIGTRRAKLNTLADLQGRKISVIGRDGSNEAFLRRLLEQYKVDLKRTDLRTVPPGTRLDTILVAAGDLVVMVEPLSRFGSAVEFEGITRDVTVHAIDDAKALERKVPGLYVETIEAGLLLGAPHLPDNDIETVALQKIMVARARMPESQVSELMRALFENGQQLGIEKTFATRIEPPDTEKGALIASHEGATRYIENGVLTFFDRYSDLIYIGMSIGSVFGSAAVALYSTVLRHRHARPIERTKEMADLRARARTAVAMTELDRIETELGGLIDEVLAGIDSGALSIRGLDVFRLALDHTRDTVAAARFRLHESR